MIMAAKGSSRHMKRLASPNYMAVGRKVATFVTKPNPGRHTLESSLALSTFIKEKLELARSTGEARKAIKGGRIEVNGRIIREPKYPIGFGDVIRIVPSDESYWVHVGKYGVFEAMKSNRKIEQKALKVVGKYLARGGKLMLRLSNGNVMHTDQQVRVNDSVLLQGSKISGVIKFEKGAKCLVVKGIHAPEQGIIKQIDAGTAQREATVVIESKEGDFQTLVKNVMAVSA